MYSRLRSAIPMRFWPAMALATLWLFALFCDMFGGSIDRFGAKCAVLALWLTTIVVPGTLLTFVMPPSFGTTTTTNHASLGAWSILLRLTVAIMLSAVTVLLWPRPLVSYKYVNTANRVRQLRIPDISIDRLPTAVLDSIPLGVSEVHKLPPAVRDALCMHIEEGSIDSWGEPYMFVFEKREDKMWWGVYSKGEDRVSTSTGNDVDDLSSWSKDGWNYYTNKVSAGNRITVAIQGGLALIFFTPICFLVFRKANYLAPT